MEIIIALISALLGGGIFKGIDAFVNRKKMTNDEDRAWRQEYRERVDDLEDDQKSLREELNAAYRREAEWKLHCENMFFDFKQFQLEMYQVLVSNGIDPSDHIKPYVFPTMRN